MKLTIVLVQSGIGDVVMCIPLLRACRDFMAVDEKMLILADSEICRQLIIQGIGQHPRICIRCVDYAWPRSRLASYLWFALYLRRLRPKRLLMPQSSARWRVPLFCMLVNAEFSIIMDSRFARRFFGHGVVGDRLHKVEFYLRFAEVAWGKKAKTPRIDLAVPQSAISRSKELIQLSDSERKIIGIAPGSGVAEVHKRWPRTHWRLLIESLLRHSGEYQVILFGGPGEMELLQTISKDLAVDSGRVAIFAESDVLLTAAALKQCECVIGGCTGTLHLAAAVGAPVVGIYGPTNPGFTGPYSDRVRIIRLGLTCSPCYRLGFNLGCGNPICMSEIRPDDVKKEVLATLAGERVPPLPWHETTSASHPSGTVSMRGYS